MDKSLFLIGNSYTYWNDDALSTYLSQAFQTYSATLGASDFAYHSSVLETSVYADNLGSDFVVLQNSSVQPIRINNWTGNYEALDILVSAINQAQGQTCFYMTWGREYAAFTYLEFQEHAKDAYERYRDAHPGSFIFPAGLVFKRIYDTNLPMFERLTTDYIGHPSLLGSYGVACVMYTSITGLPASDITYDDSTLDTQDAQEMQNAVDYIVLNQGVIDKHGIPYIYPFQEPHSIKDIANASSSTIASVLIRNILKVPYKDYTPICDYAVDVTASSFDQGAGRLTLVVKNLSPVAGVGVSIPGTVGTLSDWKIFFKLSETSGTGMVGNIPKDVPIYYENKQYYVDDYYNISNGNTLESVQSTTSAYTAHFVDNYPQYIRTYLPLQGSDTQTLKVVGSTPLSGLKNLQPGWYGVNVDDPDEIYPDGDTPEKIESFDNPSNNWFIWEVQ